MILHMPGSFRLYHRLLEYCKILSFIKILWISFKSFGKMLFLFWGNFIPPLNSHGRLLGWDWVNFPASQGFRQWSWLSKFPKKPSGRDTDIRWAIGSWPACLGKVESTVYDGFQQARYAVAVFWNINLFPRLFTPNSCYSSDSIHLSPLPFSFRRDICMNTKLWFFGFYIPDV